MADTTNLFLLKHMIIGRAASDSAYRRALLANPRRILSAEQVKKDFDRTLPPGKRLEVVEETENRLYLVLPKKNAKLIVQAQMANDPVLDLIAWAMNNEAGKEALKRDIKALLRERANIDIGDAISIQVLEDSKDVEYIVLPRNLAYIAGDYYLAQHGALLAIGQAQSSEGWGGGGGGWPGGGGPTLPECMGCKPLTTTDTAEDCPDGVFTPGDEECKCWSACVQGDVLTWDTADMPTGPGL
jgi:hypothetical protein